MSLAIINISVQRNNGALLTYCGCMSLLCELPNLGRSSLHYLCQSKSFELLRGFLTNYDQSVDIVDRDSGVTPLMAACYSGSLQCVKLLVQRGANVNRSCSGVSLEDMCYDNITPIFIAAENGHASIVEYLGKHGADVNVRMYPLGLTPLHQAVFQKHQDVVSILVKKLKANVSLPCILTPGSYPIYNAVTVDAHEILETLLLAEDADPNVTEPSEHVTALHAAAYKGDVFAVEILISNGANVNAQLKSGHSPLDLAIQEKNRHVVEYLKQKGAQRRILVKCWHPFIVCVMNGLQSTKTAVNRGADVNSLLPFTGGTALHYSVVSRDMNVCKFLIRKGADLEIKDAFGHTPLHAAADFGLNQFVEFLLDMGANINTQTDSGFTPLHRAALIGRLPTCKLLIDRGANLELVAREVGTPIIGAVCQGHTNIVKLLLRAGANPNAMNPENSIHRVTVLQMAVQCVANKPKILKALIAAGADARALIKTGYGSMSFLHIVPLVTHKVESMKIFIEAGAFLDSQALLTTRDGPASLDMLLHGPRRDVFIPMPWYRTPLQFVKKEGHPELVRLLENTDNLFKAVRKDDLNLATKYLAQGGLVNCCSVRYDTPLIYASCKGFFRMVKFLLANGAKIDMPNVHNSSPLHYAAKYNQKEVAIQLLKAGAPTNLDRCNKTPVELAQENNHTYLVAILEFTQKYLIETRSKIIAPVTNWKSDPIISQVASEFDGNISEKYLAALFEP